MSLDVNTISTNPHRELLVVAGDFPQFPTYSNSIILNRAIVPQFESVLIKTFSTQCAQYREGVEEITKDLSPKYSEEQLANLDEQGIVRVGTRVRLNDILIGKTAPVGSHLSKDEQMLRAIFSESATRSAIPVLYPFSEEGIVLERHFDSTARNKEARVNVCIRTLPLVGDILKDSQEALGVISAIEPLEIRIAYYNQPLGAVINSSSSFASHISKATGHYLWSYKTPTKPFTLGAIQAENEEEAMHPKKAKKLIKDLEQFRRGVEVLDYIGKCTIGYLLLERETPLREDKLSARSVGHYSVYSQQPLMKNAICYPQGAKVSMAEAKSLAQYPHLFAEMLREKSDDIVGRTKLYEEVVKNG